MVMDIPLVEVHVAALTQDVIRSLAAFKGRTGPVVSMYLDVDGRRYVRPRDYEQQLDALLRQAGDLKNGSTPAKADLERIAGHVRGGIDRSVTRGLAMFSCAGDGFWEVIELPVPVRNKLVVNHSPHVRQLETVLSERPCFGVLLVDRQRARMLVYEIGQLVDRSEVFDELPRHEDDRGDWDRDHLRDHTAVAAKAHLRHAARVAFEVHQQHPFDHLIISAPDELTKAVEAELHSYLRDRIAARLSIAVSASEAMITTAALEVERDIERAREAALVDRLRQGLGMGKAVAGIGPVLDALVERRVDTLLVSDGYETPGWRCLGCGIVALKGRSCPACGGDMHQVDDVVEEAVEAALALACTVLVCDGNADLDVQGRIGALLRF